MTAYLQFPDGTEQDLVVQEPDPKDGSFVVLLPEPIRIDPDNMPWIRIVP